ncbi:ATP-binding protein [Gulosibacter chungangensis]|uniref:AAA family ATPase n=1 Tax=Gulosibacter chungangensis TaxID=979746 RepID=A0A7J5BCJ2_9MICO|nr:ATP-binding protein [Gulosibacter chungangensis]KAB1643890.1 AAA family ATPase [Gulosibacter chungangensis]
MSDPLLNSLATAVNASPNDVELRTLYAARLADAGERDSAVGQVLVVLNQQPQHGAANELFAKLTGAPQQNSQQASPTSQDGSRPQPTGPAQHQAGGPSQPGSADQSSSVDQSDSAGRSDSTSQPDSTGHPDSTTQSGNDSNPADDVDWRKLEYEINNPTLPPFIINPDPNSRAQDFGMLNDNQIEQLNEQVAEWKEESVAPTEVTKESITLKDVGGLAQVKQRIHESFLDPMANPEIAKAFKKSLRGGLLLYGPPGCGKTFIARAIAGELGASFISVTLADVLSKWLGESEGNIHKTFMEARQKAPAVLFLDEIDAVGGKRSSQQSQHLRSVVNQLLMEMDGVDNQNEGVYVLAATNMPWDVDSALLRPGRFDRMVLVLPPDEPAREAILQLHLRDRPIEGIDLEKLVRLTDGFSGADLQHLTDTAAEKAMADSLKTGQVRPINMKDMQRALKEVKPSIGPWMDSARNVATYANNDGRYDDLVDYVRKSKRL